MKPKISAKTWEYKLEEQIRKQWNSDSVYNFIPKENNFVIDTPPPYPSGSTWHIGAAAHYAQIDMIARTARMERNNVYFPIGIDRNGLPVEIFTEKKYGIKLQNIDRNKFLALCKSTLDDLEKTMIQIMKCLGISGEFTDYYKTDSDEYRTLTQSTFIELWKKNYIYVANRPNNYDCSTKTTISDAEITYLNIKTELVYIKFNLKESKKTIVVSSTRPELLYSCKTIVVNPSDSRYVELVGKNVVVPIINKEIEIRSHNSVKEEFGSGIVMICSYGDQNDVTLFREFGLEETVVIDKDGKMTDVVGKYKGLKVKHARTKIIRDLVDMGLVEKIEKIEHRIPVSERSKTPIEIIPMKEYYLKQKEMLEKVKANGLEIKFYPRMHKQILIDWINSITIDWPISRRRFYGTEIPIWYCKKCLRPHVPKPGKYYRPWKEKCPISNCTICGSAEFEGEKRVLDTWMDSSISPLFISKFKKDDKFFEKTYPATIRPQAKDIVRTWLYYTLLRCEQITKTKPWSEAWIMGYGLDHKGSKMSKSADNAVSPLPIIKKVGADAFRFWSASVVNHGYDFKCSIDKIESAKKFLNKLWNVSRFISNFPIVNFVNTTNTDDWIISELDRLILKCRKGYEDYNFFIPATAIREFTWNIFASHYVEMVKNRAYGIGFSNEEKNCAIYTLHKSLSTILLLLAPITPFITDHLWKILYSKDSIHVQLQVKHEGRPDMKIFTSKIIKFNSKIWNEKKKNNISFNDKIRVDIPSELELFKNDLRSMHHIE